MKKLLVIISLLIFASNGFASKQEIKNVKAIINALNTEISKHYVIKEKAEKVSELLNNLDINQLDHKDKQKLAKQLQRKIQSVLNDKHFRINVRSPRENVRTDIIEQHIDALSNFREGGFQDIRMFEGNIGYVKIDGFRGEETHQVDGLMTYLRTADAIIVDLTENRGGSKPVNYLSSYFLAENTLIGQTYHRQKNLWTEKRSEKVKGDRRLQVPLFILTSSKTFSAAEAFTYNLQAHKRAFVIGEQTGGGAHPVSFFELPEDLYTIIPNRRSYNPITDGNWEQVGVTPDLLASKEEALDLALTHARKAANIYRMETFQQLQELINKGELTSNNVSKQDRKIAKTLIEQLLHRKHIEAFMLPSFVRRYKELNNLRAAELFSI